MGKQIKRVVLFCNYTSGDTRSHLHLSNLKMDNFLRGLLHVPALKYIDAAPWVEAFIKYFQTQEEYVLHIVAIQMGMKKATEHFEKDGVHYHYVKSGLGMIPKVFDFLWGTQKKKGYPIYQRRFEVAFKGINPDVVMICGAENPDYATAFLNTECSHKLVIMQTLMNDEKRIQMGVSNAYRREVENRVLSHCKHFAVPDVSWIQYVKQVNPSAVCYPFTFPTIKPVVNELVEKQYDFVFFAGILGRNKGTNDLVSAMAILCKKYPDATLNIIGSADEEYMKGLYQQVEDDGLEPNIIFTPPFPKREDVFYEVCKSKVAVLPGITASLNSTVREAMLMGMPTIAYETADTLRINSDSRCILTAKMEDVEDLSAKLEYAISNPDTMCSLAKSGKDYADNHFTQKAFDQSLCNILGGIINQ